MKPNIPIAIGAGLISAIVFASATTGHLVVRVALLAIVTLPIALAGFSYNAYTSAAAAAVATLGVCLLGSPIVGSMYALTFALPTVLLVYLLLLHQSLPDGKTVWYPIGRVVIISALLAGSVVSAAMMLGGNDVEKLHAIVRKSVEQAFGSGMAGLPKGAAWGDVEIDAMTDMMLNLLPGASATYWMACQLFCLWLAARIALTSGLLARPWPDLAAFTLPLGTPVLLGAALATTLVLDGVPRLMALGFAGVVFATYVLLGLAIIHYRSRGSSWRGGVLAAVYAGLVILNTLASVVIALIGLADSFVALRRPPVPLVPTTSDLKKP